MAVLAVYRARPDAFTREDLRVLQAFASNLGLAVEGALQRSGAVDSAKSSGLAASAGG